MNPTAPREVLELAARYYEECLWSSESGSGVRGRMERWALSDATLREFGVGYAPGKTRPFLEHFGQEGVSERELLRAGLAGESERGGIHVRFHADAAALNFVIVGVATTYLLLAIAAARLSARAGSQASGECGSRGSGAAGRSSPKAGPTTASRRSSSEPPW